MRSKIKDEHSKMQQLKKIKMHKNLNGWKINVRALGQKKKQKYDDAQSHSMNKILQTQSAMKRIKEKGHVQSKDKCSRCM